MPSQSDRFRHYYQHECWANARVLEMLDSVPPESRGDLHFKKALDLAGHLAFWRRRWLHSLGAAEHPGKDRPGTTSLESLRELWPQVESAWTAWLATLDDHALARDCEWSGHDGRRRHWSIEGVLTQVNGHAWYHRGQIAQLIGQLGGKPVSTDYYFWNPPSVLEEPKP